MLALIGAIWAISCGGAARWMFGSYSEKVDETADPACRICTARRIPTDAGAHVEAGL